jgi:hypothetical protein
MPQMDNIKHPMALDHLLGLAFDVLDAFGYLFEGQNLFTYLIVHIFYYLPLFP